jgi:hypothetical protein
MLVKSNYSVDFDLILISNHVILSLYIQIKQQFLLGKQVSISIISILSLY